MFHSPLRVALDICSRILPRQLFLLHLETLMSEDRLVAFRGMIQTVKGHPYSEGVRYVGGGAPLSDLQILQFFPLKYSGGRFATIAQGFSSLLLESSN